MVRSPEGWLEYLRVWRDVSNTTPDGPYLRVAQIPEGDTSTPPEGCPPNNLRVTQIPYLRVEHLPYLRVAHSPYLRVTQFYLRVVQIC